MAKKIGKIIGITVGTIIGIIVLLGIGFFAWGVLAVEGIQNEFTRHMDNLTEVSVKVANDTINEYLLEFSENPTKGLSDTIQNILKQNETLLILTYFDDKDPKDTTKNCIPTNSINFRRIKNNNIEVFTDYDIMRKYYSNIKGKYIASDIMSLGAFVKLCFDYGGITSITLNFSLLHPYTFNINADK
ncbi:MAG: hypothetical protein FWF46_09650 [Oscillospiraceae bacterium]|nr:hypothetical protein [Oscillospiraceae bacterium]